MIALDYIFIASIKLSEHEHTINTLKFKTDAEDSCTHSNKMFGTNVF